MIESYKAILRGDRLEWRGAAPEETNGGEGVEVYVTIARRTSISSRASSDGKAMAGALSKLAASRSVAGIADATTWQR